MFEKDLAEKAIKEKYGDEWVTVHIIQEDEIRNQYYVCVKMDDITVAETSIFRVFNRFKKWDAERIIEITPNSIIK